MAARRPHRILKEDKPYPSVAEYYPNETRYLRSLPWTYPPPEGLEAHEFSGDLSEHDVESGRGEPKNEQTRDRAYVSTEDHVQSQSEQSRVEKAVGTPKDTALKQLRQAFSHGIQSFAPSPLFHFDSNFSSAPTLVSNDTFMTVSGAAPAPLRPLLPNPAQPSALPMNPPTSGMTGFTNTFANPQLQPDRRWPCPMAEEKGCTMLFTTPAAAERHRGTHTGRKDFACPDCGRMFARKDVMQAHRRVHSGSRGSASTNA